MASILAKTSQKFKTEGVRGILRSVSSRLFTRTAPVNRGPVRFVAEHLCQSGDFTIVQIGAYIGNSWSDPLFKPLSKRLQHTGGTLVCIEPVKEYFNRLVQNYDGIDNVIFENVAIADENRTDTFYRIGVDPVAYGYPEWLSQIGSLKKERMGDMWDNYEADDDLKAFYLQHQIEETVTCITIDKLMTRNNLDQIDLLQMDVEGYEFEILKTLDTRKYDIRFINFESVLLNENKPAAIQLMESQGYLCFDFDQDTFCYRKEDAELIESWKKTLKP